MAKGGKREGSGPKPRAITNSKLRSIRFTDAEWETLKTKASLANTTISDYIRRKALE